MAFLDRAHAALELSDLLKTKLYSGERPLVLAIPRGSVPMGMIIADQLGGDLDVVLVHKVGAPDNPEYAIGSVSEFGNIHLSEIVPISEFDEDYILEATQREIDRLREKRAAYSPIRPPIDPQGRTVILVDDGIATGSTMLAAIAAVRARNPKKMIVAAPAASLSAVELLRDQVDEVVAIEISERFFSVSQFYLDFPQVSDEEVEKILSEEVLRNSKPRYESEVIVTGHKVQLPGKLTLPISTQGLVIFAHGSGSGRLSPRNLQVARTLNQAGLGTLLFDLLTEPESRNRNNVFDIPFLASRLTIATRWALRWLEERSLDIPIGYFGASTGAAAALWAAAELKEQVSAVVSRGGRPDLAIPKLEEVVAPTLLLVGGEDYPVLDMNEEAFQHLTMAELVIIPKATHLFEEPGTLETVSRYATTWFKRYLKKARSRERKVA